MVSVMMLFCNFNFTWRGTLGTLTPFLQSHNVLNYVHIYMIKWLSIRVNSQSVKPRRSLQPPWFKHDRHIRPEQIDIYIMVDKIIPIWSDIKLANKVNCKRNCCPDLQLFPCSYFFFFLIVLASNLCQVIDNWVHMYTCFWAAFFLRQLVVTSLSL